MFTLKEVSEQEEQFKLTSEKMITQMQQKEYEMSLLSKQNAILEHKL